MWKKNVLLATMRKSRRQGGTIRPKANNLAQIYKAQRAGRQQKSKSMSPCAKAETERRATWDLWHTQIKREEIDATQDT